MSNPSLTRREALALGATGVLATVLAGCAGDDDDGATAVSSSAGDGTSVATAGTSASTSVGAVDADVAVLDEIAALAVLSLGVVPRSVDALFGYATVAEICEHLGVTVNPGARNVEAVAADRPSAIVGVSIPTFVEAVDQFEAIAPTVVVDFTLGWAEQLDVVAEALGRQDVAQERTASLEAAVEQLRSDVEAAGKAGTVVSVLAGSADGPFAIPAVGLVGEVITDAGLDRPAAQQEPVSSTAPFIDVSAERLEDHDGDVIVLMTGPGYPREPVEASPLWSGLGAVTAGEVYDVVAEVWFAASPFSVDWVLRDLRAAVLGDGSPATAEQAVERWDEFAQA